MADSKLKTENCKCFLHPSDKPVAHQYNAETGKIESLEIDWQLCDCPHCVQRRTQVYDIQNKFGRALRLLHEDYSRALSELRAEKSGKLREALDAYPGCRKKQPNT